MDKKSYVQEVMNNSKDYATKTILTKKLTSIHKQLHEYVQENKPVHQTGDIQESMNYTLFISVSDGKSRARVAHVSSPSFNQSWNMVVDKTFEMMKKFDVKPIWIKVDLVNWVQKIPYAALKNIVLSAKFGKFLRMGFSLDTEFDLAFLEAEANSYKLYDYTVIPLKASKPGHDKVPVINKEQIEKYLLWYKESKNVEIGNYVYLFNCKSYFVDQDNVTYSLYDKGLRCGRREVEEVDATICKNILTTASQYLTRQLKEDGSFIYGYYPSFDSMMKSYNILRHTGTLWSMMCAYDVTQDPSIKPVIEKSLDYLESQILYYDNNIAFVLEAKDEEIKLGGLGVAIIAMTKYMETYGDRDYRDLVSKLANGIIHMQHPETGQLAHVLYSDDFTLKEATRTVYYDGESTYALVKAYEVTKEKKYLEAAQLSIDYFIRNNYIKYRDHWLAYAMNEFTKFVHDEVYYTFALKNAWENRKRIDEQPTSYHTYLELLMETYDIYLRIKEEKRDIPYMKNIDEVEFVRIIKHRAWHMLDGYFYPEYAMYMSKPGTILGSFFVRHDGFRTRIDDDQHFIDGYSKYYKLIC